MQGRQGGVRAGFQDLAEQPSVRDLDQLVGGKGTMALPLCRFAQDMYDAGLEAARVIEADAGIDGDLVRRSKADPADFGSQEPRILADHRLGSGAILVDDGYRHVLVHAETHQPDYSLTADCLGLSGEHL